MKHKVDPNILKRARMYLTKNSKHEQTKQQRNNYRTAKRQSKKTDNQPSQKARLKRFKLDPNGIEYYTPNEKP